MNIDDFLPVSDLARITKGYCPRCNHRGFVFGPRGGPSQNVECGNIICRERFNITFHPMACNVVIGQRIEKQKDGGSDNWGMPDA